MSDWGHDFRPDYRRIRTLLERLDPTVPVLATTATANERVVADRRRAAGCRRAGGRRPGGRCRRPGRGGSRRGPGGARRWCCAGGLDRRSLHLSVVETSGPAHRLAWLAQHLPRLTGSGVVYALTVAAAEETADFLRRQGLEVRAYTGRTESSEREQLEADLLADRVKALVATSALGMGFDKPDLGFVVHLGAPSSPVAVLPAGRSRRAAAWTAPTWCCCRGARDEAIWRYFASVGFPAEAQVRQVLDALADEGGGPVDAGAGDAGGPAPHPARNRPSRCSTWTAPCGACGAGGRRPAQPWTYDAERYAHVAQGPRRRAAGRPATT